MVAAMAAPLAERGVAHRRADRHRLPVHRGGGREPAPSSRASSRRRSRCDRHRAARDRARATRPAARDTPFADDVPAREARGCSREGKPPEEIRDELEKLNLGRLRVASKGIDPRRRAGQATAGAKLRRGRRRGAAPRRHVHDRPGRRAARPHLHASPSCTTTCRPAAARRAWARSPPSAGRRRRARPEPRPSRRRHRRHGLPAAEGAATCRRYWANILNKVDAITEVPQERWDWRPLLRPRPARRATRSTRSGAASSTTCRSTRVRYGMPPTALPSIEPLQLLTLEVGRARRSPTPGYLDRPFDRERTSVILGASGGVGRPRAPATAAALEPAAARSARGADA